MIRAKLGLRHNDDDDEEDTDDDDDEDDDDDDDDDDHGYHPMVIKRAAYRPSSRTVTWKGPSSYQGYDKTAAGRKSKAPQVPPRTYQQGTQSTRKSGRPVKVPLHNKARANDPTYQQGLDELAELM